MEDGKETELLLQTGTATCRRWRERRTVESRSASTLGATSPRATLVDMSISHTPPLPADFQRLADDYFDLMHHQDLRVRDVRHQREAKWLISCQHCGCVFSG